MLVSLLASGCFELGPCDEALAREVAYLQIEGVDASGLGGQPAFLGQALMATSCGNGAFCHAASAEGDARYGVASGLDFDVRIACDDRSPQAGCERDQTERLRVDQRTTYHHRQGIYEQVVRGLMPPGRLGREIRASAHYYVQSDDTPVPELRSRGGQRILANWLACGAPVVERAIDPTDGYEVGDYCGDEQVGDCIVGRPRHIDPPEPRWRSIFDRVIYPFCGVTCHGPGDPDYRLESELDLSTPDIAYAQLVGVVASGSDCSNSGMQHVEPGAPERSLLMDKMRPNPVCGERMPGGGSVLPEELLEPMDEWIRLGAAND